MREENGKLVVVGTPIGNLGDMTLRAIEALRSADVIVCEDTRVTRKLLSHFEILGKSMIAMPKHKEAEVAARVVVLLNQGQAVALVTDAGMPTISDPGQRVVAAAIEADRQIEVTPGPTAVSAAIALSGLLGERYTFEGFLPRRGQDRRTRITDIAGRDLLSVLYEAPTRVKSTLTDLAAALEPGRRVVVVRELTKRFEEVWRGSAGELVDFANRDHRGEFVILIEGISEIQGPDDSEIAGLIEVELAAGNSVRDAAKAVSNRLDIPRDRAYYIALDIKRKYNR